jgi:hypothetical protein
LKAVCTVMNRMGINTSLWRSNKHFIRKIYIDLFRVIHSRTALFVLLFYVG